jgi:hypothetical protein
MHGVKRPTHVGVPSAVLRSPRCTPALLPVLLTLAPVAQAGGALSIKLELHHCGQLSQAEVERIFAADLGVSLSELEPREGVSVQVACNGSTIALRVDDRISRKHSERTIELQAENPKARSRLVAIAAAELVLASWAELAVNPDPEVEPEGIPVQASTKLAVRRLVTERIDRPRPARPRADEEERGVARMLALASTRQIFNAEGQLWGFGVRGGYDQTRLVSWAADALFEAGTVRPGTADLHLSVATASAAVFFHHRWGVLTGRVGAGLRAGLTVSSTGEEESGHATASPWGWPLGALSVSVFPIGPLVLDLQGEAGYAVLPVAGTGGGAGAAIRGMWLGLQLGAGITF